MSEKLHWLSIVACSALASAVPAFGQGGNILLTGHDVEIHGGQNGWDLVALDFLRCAGTPQEIPAASYQIAVIGQGTPCGSWSTGGAGPAGYPAIVLIDASLYANVAQWTPILSSGGTPLFDCILVSSHTSGFGCLTAAHSTNLNFAQPLIQSLFNQGMDIWANTAGTSATYYNFLPAGFVTTGVPISTSDICATAIGTSMGLNCSRTAHLSHNSFAAGTFSPVLSAWERICEPANCFTGSPTGEIVTLAAKNIRLGDCAYCQPPSPGFQPSIDQRCGNLPDSTAHYSIDAIGLINNPCGFISVGQRNLPSGLPGVHVVHWNRNGSIIRERLFSTTVANELIVGTSVDVNSDCDILIAGRTQGPSGLATFVARLDQYLLPVWSTRLPGNNSGAENVQADWLNDGFSVAVSGMAGTGGNLTRGRLTKLDALTGSCIWWKEYSSTFSAADRFIIEDLEQAPGVNGNIFVCGGLQYTLGGNPTVRVPMIMEVAVAGAPAGLPVGIGVRAYPFPAGSPWTTSRYTAIKFDPTFASPFQNDIIVAGWATRPVQPFGFALSGRVGIINSTAGAVQHWDNLYNGFSVLPGTSAISIAPQNFVSPNQIVVAGRDQDSWFGRTLRVSESSGAFNSAQSHGFPNIPFQTYRFADITPGGFRAMIGHYSDSQPIPDGGARLYFSLGTCPTPGTATLENMVVQNLQSGEVSVGNAQPCMELVLVEVEAHSPCDILCQSSRLGDLNCDGAVTVSDIGGFVLALTDPAGYASQFPDCDISNADMNNDGNVTVSDIGLFVQVLTGG